MSVTVNAVEFDVRPTKESETNYPKSAKLPEEK
jgi:hypothetical protein